MEEYQQAFSRGISRRNPWINFQQEFLEICPNDIPWTRSSWRKILTGVSEGVPCRYCGKNPQHDILEVSLGVIPRRIPKRNSWRNPQMEFLMEYPQGLENTSEKKNPWLKLQQELLEIYPDDIPGGTSRWCSWKNPQKGFLER